MNPIEQAHSASAVSEKRLLSVDEVSESTGLGRSTLYEFLRNGSLRSLKIGKLRRIRPEDLDAWIETHLEDSSEG